MHAHICERTRELTFENIVSSLSLIWRGCVCVCASVCVSVYVDVYVCVCECVCLSARWQEFEKDSSWEWFMMKDSLSQTVSFIMNNSHDESFSPHHENGSWWKTLSVSLEILNREIPSRIHRESFSYWNLCTILRRIYYESFYWWINLEGVSQEISTREILWRIHDEPFSWWISFEKVSREIILDYSNDESHLRESLENSQQRDYFEYWSWIILINYLILWSHTHLCDKADVCLSPSSPPWKGLLRILKREILSRIHRQPF